eukprot:14038174-Alexandrium_andersonii.AAC.1
MLRSPELSGALSKARPSLKGLVGTLKNDPGLHTALHKSMGLSNALRGFPNPLGSLWGLPELFG